MTKRKKEEEEKRCIPKEGMPHVHKTCRKKEKQYTHTHSPCPRKNTEREIDHPMKFNYPPKIFHTLAPLDQVV